MSTRLNRRDFRRGAAATSALLMTTRPSRAFAEPRRFAPVKVSRDRVIREVVGLRLYRASGFVAEAERFGNKLLVHNYGHGSGGVAPQRELPGGDALYPRASAHTAIMKGVTAPL